MKKSAQTTTTATMKLVQRCCQALDAKKAENVQVLDVRTQSSITDYLVVATGTSEPHLRALRIELEKVLGQAGTRVLGIEAIQESGWIVVDVFDVMVHLFLPEMRGRYALENLWKDAIKVPPSKCLLPRKREKNLLHTN